MQELKLPRDMDQGSKVVIQQNVFYYFALLHFAPYHIPPLLNWPFLNTTSAGIFPCFVAMMPLSSQQLPW